VSAFLDFLEDPFAQISRVISTMISAKVGGERIAGFLRLPVVDEVRHCGLEADESSAENMRVSRIKSQIRYTEDLHVPPGTSLAVVGGVGSGKSTFLHVLMGEMSWLITQGLEIRGVSHEIGCASDIVSQEAFILNGTLLENLTFGRHRCFRF
jgi:ABC-type multidrug transport system fused ATPase/permease subunit